MPRSDTDLATYLRGLFLDAYRCIAGEGRLIGDKYNEYLLQLPELLRILPDARYVFLHRAPLASARSAQQKFAGRPWCPESVAAGVVKWANWNRCWLLHREAIPAGQRFEIALADLADRPRACLTALCRFLGLDPSPIYLNQAAGLVRRPHSYLEAPENRAVLTNHTPGARDALEVARRLGYAPDLRWCAPAWPDAASGKEWT